MYKTMMTGNLVADPERKDTKSGKAMAIFTLAVDKGYGSFKTTLYIRCLAWEKLAEVAMTYLHKGDKILASGELTAGAYMGKDGQPKANMEMTVQEIEFMSVRGNRSGDADTGGEPAW